MALLSERSIIHFPQCYKFIIVVILLMVHNQAANSSEADLKDLVYLHNNNHNNLSSELSKYKRDINNNRQFCEIPYNRLHTQYKILIKSEVNYGPGDLVQTSILETICHKGYNLSLVIKKHSICLNGKWDPTPAMCSRTCPSLTSTSSTIVKCSYKGTPLDNCLSPVNETTVILSCNTFYEEASVERNPIRVCRNGKWIPPIPQCYPSCGMKTAKGKPNIINGRNATIGDYPWHIGIYNSQKELICGGSIIDQRTILTAAHCLTNHSGNTYPTTEFFIGAGKRYRNYQDDRDQLAQYSNVLAIHVPEKYKGPEHFYANDIAVVILTRPLTLSEVVLPVCIELNEGIRSLDVSANKNGIVTGWGHTEEGRKLSEVLKELRVPYIPYERCFNEVQENFRRFITSDKVCGGFRNSSTSICGGDSGGGFTLKNVINNRYYLRGVVSTSPATEELACDSNEYSLYTEVSHHTNFVRDLVQSYQQQQSVECIEEDCTDQEPESRNSCIFPNFPPNGKYILFSQDIIYSPGDYVPLESTLALSCDTGYEMSSSHESYSYCTDNGQWMPAPGSCEKECGIVIERRTTLSGGDSLLQHFHSWMGVIMDTSTDSYIYRCTGILVSKKHVITAGHCELLDIPVEDLLVILGNDWIDFENLRKDSKSFIVSRVSQVFVHPDFNLDSSDSDIAVLALRDFNFKSDYVRPICLWNESDDLDLIISEFGLVIGWTTEGLIKEIELHPYHQFMSIVPDYTCLRSNQELTSIISERTFCAGKRDGTGPCFAANGAGFMMQRNGRWTLRGILSKPFRNGISACARYEYFVFADIAKYKRWLNEVLT